MNRYLIVAFGVLALSTPALAQIQVPGPINSADGKSSRPRGRVAAEPAPVGVPGSRADTSLTGPAAPIVVDMPPNEALFDSINRGDISASREAIGRGADIQAHNILGLTPLELSVDLGRNDISFLLLSLRGGAGYSGTRQAQASAPPTAAQRRAERVAEQAALRQEQAASRRTARLATNAPMVPNGPRRFAGDGGAPVPQAGFLGFDAVR